MAKALPGLPVIRAAFAAGELPYSKVRALTRIATAEHEAELLDFARAATTDQLERSIRAWRQATRDVGEDGDGEASEVHPSWTDDGFGDLRARLKPEDAAVVFAALDAEAERLAQEELRDAGSAEPSSPRSVPVSPLAQRRALNVRDARRCRFPGCTTAVGLHGHHVRWWERDHGTTDITNLALLCRRHHRLVHRGAFTITGDNRGNFVFTRTDGTELETSPPPPRTSTTIGDANAAAGARVVQAPAGGTGERLSLTWAVDGLMSRARAS